MSEYRIREAAALLGVSGDVARRWADAGRLEVRRSAGGQRLVQGPSLARLAAERAGTQGATTTAGHSTRNRFLGIVTRVAKDAVAAQVEIQCGPHRIVALVTAEAAEELGLEPGVVAVAAVKATQISVEIPPNH